MGKLADIYRLYSLCMTYIGELTDIYGLYFSCTPSIGKLTDIYRLYLFPPSMGKLTDIYGVYFLCTTYIGKLADIYRLYFSRTPSMGELTDIYRIHIFLFISLMLFLNYRNVLFFLAFSTFILQLPFLHNKKCDVQFYTSHFLIIVSIYTIIFYKIRKIIS